MEPQPARPRGDSLRQKWAELLFRLVERSISTIDIVSILFFDAMILGVGFFVLEQTKYLPSDRLPADAAAFFEAAHTISAGLFLLLYAVVAAFHVYRFVRTELGA